MSKTTRSVFLFLLTWACGATYFALQSPSGIQAKEFVTALYSGRSNDVSFQEGYDFVQSTVKSFYDISMDTSISDKEVFLTSYFSRRISNSLREDYIKTAKRAKSGLLKRSFSIKQILFDLKKRLYIVSVKISQKDQELGKQDFYVKLSIAIRKSFQGSGEYQVSVWDEVPSEKPFTNYLTKNFFVKADQTSQIAFPCETNSLLSTSEAKGVDSKLFKNGSLIEFSFKDELEKPATYTMKCGKRKFESRFLSAENKITLYRQVALNEGKLPRKKKTDLEKALEGLKGWKK